ncbi:MAG TPA: HAMP domain-containing protein [candidate division WOR-3 bacterium]|uniref:histidine kinase n=1 Tax=candidate division WOR-3 bacterium TaxID=2052148 RepID=A0A9C9EPI2_UNCW3|nr:HAMP domain-containing protein [candidate division WOR-3 bacterium]
MKRLRKKYIINKKYQYGAIIFALTIIFIIIFISIFVTHYFLLSTIIRKIEQTGYFPRGMELINLSFKPLVIVIPVIFILLALSYIVVIFISHRTAGPLYSLKKAMEQVGEGDLSVRLKFRKNDEIHDVAESFNRMVDGLRKKFGNFKSSSEK